MTVLNREYRSWSSWLLSPLQVVPAVSLARSESFPHADSALLGFLGRPPPALRHSDHSDHSDHSLRGATPRLCACDQARYRQPLGARRLASHAFAKSHASACGASRFLFRCGGRTPSFAALHPPLTDQSRRMLPFLLFPSDQSQFLS